MQPSRPSCRVGVPDFGSAPAVAPGPRGRPYSPPLGFRSYQNSDTDQLGRYDHCGRILDKTNGKPVVWLC